MRKCVCASVRACVKCLKYIYDIDNNILLRLIMIITKIIFLYFIEITHTDDFPSMGTRLVVYKSLRKKCPYTCTTLAVGSRL